MNPQADNAADGLNPSLNPQTPLRPSGQVAIPARPGPSPSNVPQGAPVQTPATRPVPAAPPRQVAAAPPVRAPQPVPPQAAPMQQPVQTIQQAPSAPAQPIPQPPVPSPVVIPPQPIQQQPTQQPQPTQSLPQVSSAPVPAPAPPIQPSPVPTPTPPAAMPPSGQPAAAVTAPPAPSSPDLSDIPPMPVAAVEPTATPSQTAAGITPIETPTTTLIPEAPTGPHASKELIERIDETPQQSSRDIEGLIEHSHQMKRLKGFLSFLIFVAGVVVAALFINQFIFQSYYVDGTSMTPTLQNDDRLIIDKVEHTIANLQGKPYVPERGQIIVLDSSIVGFNGRQEQLIKRVIGLPGDTITIRDGEVIVRNKQNPDGFDPAKQLGLNLQPTFVDSPQEWTIKDNQVFVMGDNRVENGSYDSRAFGPIETNKIVGRLWARILPFDKAQTF